MKKLLFVLAIGAFAACNDATTDTESTGDTSAINNAPYDTTSAAPLDTTSLTPVDTSVVK